MPIFWDTQSKFATGIGGGYQTVINSVASGTQTAWNPGISGNTLVFWDGSGGSLTIQGIAAAPAGTMFTLKNTAVSFAQAGFTHESGSAAAADRVSNKFTGISTPVFNNGHITYIHDGTNWRIVDYMSGRAVNPAFVAGNYTGTGSSTWTVASGDVATFIYYTMRGVIVALNVNTSTVAQNGGDPTALNIASTAWAGGLTVANHAYTFPVFILDNNVATRGYGTIAASATSLVIKKEDGSQFANSTDLTGVYANFSVECV